jgi:hypothetical protein
MLPIAAPRQALWIMRRRWSKTADHSDKEMYAALDINLPNYAISLVTTDEVIASIIFSLRRWTPTRLP